MLMHGLIRECLEEYLKGGPGSAVPRELEAHLKHCEECRDELAVMQEQAFLLHSLRTAQEMEPAAGFYARVMNRIETQQGNSIWSVFLDPAFGRRIALASLTIVVLLGSVMALTETQVAYAPEGRPPEAVIAGQEHPNDMGRNRQRDRDTILVDLASYRE